MSQRIGGRAADLYVERQASPERVVFTLPRRGCLLLAVVGVLACIACSLALSDEVTPFLRVLFCAGVAALLLSLILIMFRQKALYVDVATSHVVLVVRSPLGIRRTEIPFEDIREIEVRATAQVRFADQQEVSLILRDNRYIPLGNGREWDAIRLAHRLAALTRATVR